jgi:hypothetical protein
MPFIPAVDTARVSLLTDLDGQNLINTLWFKHRAGAIGIPDLEALGAGVNDWFVANILTLMSNQAVYLGCIAYDYTTEFAPAVNSAIVGTAGGDASPQLPNNCAFCVKFLTGGRGRSSRGRNYVGAATQNWRSDPNHVDTSVADALVAGYDAILGLPIDADWEWSVVSFRFNKLPRVTALIQPVIGVAYSDTVLDSQRRRLPGRGR